MRSIIPTFETVFNEVSKAYKAGWVSEEKYAEITALHDECVAKWTKLELMFNELERR